MPAPFFRHGKTSRGPTPYVPAGSIRVRRLPSVTLICVAQPTVIGRRPLREQDAHVVLADVAQLRARVVVREDPAVLPAVPRVAVRAPLAHADAVPPAVPGDDQLRAARAVPAVAQTTAATSKATPNLSRTAMSFHLQGRSNDEE